MSLNYANLDAAYDQFVVGTVNNVAFKNPDGSIALVAENTGGAPQTFQVSYGGASFPYTLPASAMATFTWPGGTVVTPPPTTPPVTTPPAGTNRSPMVRAPASCIMYN